MRSVFINDDYAIAKSTNENWELRGQKLFAVRVEGASTGASPLRVT
ncbi:hypothetical protein [Pseudanabaena minima]